MRDRLLMTRLSKGLMIFAAVLMAAATSVAATPSAFAQSAKKSGAKGSKKKAQEQTARKVLALIKAANTAFDAKNYDEAFAKYKQAYALYPDPAILVRLGKTSEKMGHTEDAIHYYREFVRIMPDDSATPKLKSDIAALEKTLPVEVTVNSEPQGAKVYLTMQRTKVVGTTPAKIKLTPGKHTLYLDRDGFEAASKQVDVETGKPQQVSVALSPAHVASKDASAVVEQPMREPSSIGVYGWTALGVGVATLATSGVFVALKSSAEDKANNYDKRAPGATRQELQDLEDNANSYYDTALITGIAGGVLTAAGAGLLTYHYTAGDKGDEVAVSVGARFDSERAWIGVDGSF